jgi:hypothetical protein
VESVDCGGQHRLFVPAHADGPGASMGRRLRTRQLGSSFSFHASRGKRNGTPRPPALPGAVSTGFPKVGDGDGSEVATLRRDPECPARSRRPRRAGMEPVAQGLPALFDRLFVGEAVVGDAVGRVFEQILSRQRRNSGSFFPRRRSS